MKAFKCLKLPGEMRLNTLGRHVLLGLIYIQDILRSSFDFQLYTPNPYLEIHRNIFVFVQVHPFGIPYLHIFIIQIQFIILKPSIYVGLTPNDQ